MVRAHRRRPHDDARPSPGTEIYYGDGPIVDFPPYAKLDAQPRRHCADGRCPTIGEGNDIHRRSTNPYEKKPAVSHASRIAETEDAVGVVVSGEGFSDQRVLVAFDVDKDHTLTKGREAFTFRDHATTSPTARAARSSSPGNVTAFRFRLAHRCHKR